MASTAALRRPPKRTRNAARSRSVTQSTTASAAAAAGGGNSASADNRATKTKKKKKTTTTKSKSKVKAEKKSATIKRERRRKVKREQADGAAAGDGGPGAAPPLAALGHCAKPVRRRKLDGTLAFADHPEFRPNLAPYQVLQMGAFGGTYWRRIKSAVTGITYSNRHREFPAVWYTGIEEATHLTRPWTNYNKAVNRYGVKCGGDLNMWESSGWMRACDPYGWFQWYCRFFLGRRCDDDSRQIARWKGVCSNKGRFRNMLIGKCARGGKSFDDPSISPVVRQSLQHWGYILTAEDADEYAALKGLPELPASIRPQVDVATVGVPKALLGSIEYE